MVYGKKADWWNNKCRMLLTMAVSLYTSGVVLNTLGGGGLRHLQCPGRHSADVRFPQWADGGINSAIFDV